MAHTPDLFDCSICLGLLEEPVTTTCGHSYCMKCINTFWDTTQDNRGSYSCPQCRQTFNTRPALKRNTILANLLEEHKKTTKQSAAPSAASGDDIYAAPGDVQCDFCSGRKRKAHMFCQVCLASYCETHLEPHFQVPPLQKHKLIKASTKIKESICSRHDKLQEIYCRTDRQFLCLLCAVEEHKGHDTISVTEEKQEMQRHLEKTKWEIADRVLTSEAKMEKLVEAAGSVRENLRTSENEFNLKTQQVVHQVAQNSHCSTKSWSKKYKVNDQVIEGPEVGSSCEKRPTSTPELKLFRTGEWVKIPPSICAAVQDQQLQETTRRSQQILKDKDAAWEACDDFERVCEERILLYNHFVRKKCSEMRERVGEAEKAGVDWTECHLRQLKREVSELRRRESEICQLSQTDDPLQFLQGFQALGDLPVHTDSDRGLDNLTKFVTAQKDKMKKMCDQEKKDLVDFSEKASVAKGTRLQKIFTRTELLNTYKNSKVEVDPDTVAACLHLSDTKKEISWCGTAQAHPDHPNRFTYFNQALCKEGLRGNHYWEVEWDGGIVEVAVSYKGIERKGSGKDCCFGHNALSWKLICFPFGCTFWHNNLHKGQIPPVHSQKVGVHLDYEEGKLAFYSISGLDSLTLLHQIQTTFTEPLYPGFSVDFGATLKICNI